MRILFVYPNLNGQLGFHYGIASLSAVLRRAGHETSLINLNEALAPAPAEGEFRAAVESVAPDVVGFSVVTPQYRTSLALAAEAKQAGATVVFGGVHATMVPEQVAAEPDVDFVCVGEGEEAFLELVEAISAGADPTGIRNIGGKRDGRVYVNPVRPFAALDSLPDPDYEIFDFQNLTDRKNGWVGLMASRGCPFRCSYCFNHSMVERYRRDLGVPARDLHYVRWLPVKRLVAGMRGLVSRYTGIRMFIFDDDLFTHDKDYVAEFSQAWAGDASVPLTVNAHVRRFDAATAQALAAANCRIVKFGIESGSPAIRSEVLNRHMTDGHISSAFETAHSAGMATSAFVMTGLPRETPRDLDMTFDVLANVRPHRFRWSTFYPFPGTRAFDMAAADGSLDPKKMSGIDNFFGESCLDLGPEMNRLVRRVNRTFPWCVNAKAGGRSGRFWSSLVDTFHAMPDREFEARSRDFRRIDAEMAGMDEAAGGDPYRIRYNDFMAVRSGGGAED